MLIKQISQFILLLLVSQLVCAHHSLTAHYDVRNPRTLEGTLKTISWRNPHSQFQIEVMNEQGNIETWRLEGGAINTIRRQGIDMSTIRKGDTVRFFGAPARSGRNDMVAAKLFHNDNEYKIFGVLAKLMKLPGTIDEDLGYQTSAASHRIESHVADDVFRVWFPIQFPGVGVVQMELPLTDFAVKTAENYDEAADDLAVKCEPPGMPSMLDQPYPIQIINEGDRIVMIFEEWNAKRFIAMNDKPLTEKNHPRYGDSKGRWENETLVIETTNIDYPYYDDAGTPMTRDMVVTERYGLNEDRSRLEWSAHIEDPNVFTKPMTIDGYFVYSPKYKIEEYKCR
jgi:hypothetical protein